MNQSLAELKQNIKIISAKKRQWDELFSDLQGLLKGKIGKMSVPKVRQEFQIRVQRLKQAVRNNNQELESIKYNLQKLHLSRNDIGAPLRSVQALCEYFQDLGRKVKEQQARGEKEISEREKWEIAQHEQESLQEDSQLISTTGAAREVRQQAQMVLSNIQSQGGRLQAARQRMSTVLKNINLSGNITNLLKKRSKEDNKLILMLTLGLVLQIYLCVYHIRPFLKGY